RDWRTIWPGRLAELAMPRVDINARYGLALGDGVDEAWTMNPAARQGDPAAHETKNAPNGKVREYLVMLPTGMRTLGDRLAAHRANGGPAVVRLCPGPGGHGFPLEAWAVSPIPEFCEREELALGVDYDGAPAFPWSELVAFARAYPRLTVLALGAPLGGPT